MGQDVIFNRVEFATTQTQLAGRTVPCKHTSTEEHPTQKNGAITPMSASIFSVFSVP